MNTGLLNKDTFAQRYPEKKPVCLNYATVREDLLALIEEVEALRSLLTFHIEQGNVNEHERQFMCSSTHLRSKPA